jgi:hypothetical protein
MISGFGSRVYGLWLKSWGLGCRVSQGSRLMFQSVGSSTGLQVINRRFHPGIFFFRFLAMKITAQMSLVVVISEHLCSNFNCQKNVKRYVSPDEVMHGLSM